MPGTNLIEETFRGVVRYRVTCEAIGTPRSKYTIGYVKRQHPRKTARWVFVKDCRRSDKTFKTRKQALEALVSSYPVESAA